MSFLLYIRLVSPIEGCPVYSTQECPVVLPSIIIYRNYCCDESVVYLT